MWFIVMASFAVGIILGIAAALGGVLIGYKIGRHEPIITRTMGEYAELDMLNLRDTLGERTTSDEDDIEEDEGNTRI